MPKKSTLTVMLVMLLCLGTQAFAERKQFKIAWSIYVGWMPWDYADKQGIVKKWAQKYGIDIQVVQINDYIESINQYTAGAFDACVMTNMDGLTIPAAGGVDSTALIVGDFSNGNDGVILKGKTKLTDIKGQKVNLVELSVSHYLLARALDSVGMSEKDIQVVNTSDADIVAVSATPSVSAVVTWNPQLSEVKAMPNAHMVFDSSKIPGEIIDLTIVNSKTLAENPALGKALAGAWYEVMGIMAKQDEQGKQARTIMGKASGTDLAGFEKQLASTKMFYSAKDGVAFTTGAELMSTMDKVRQFSYTHGLLGEGAKSPDQVGIAFPGNKVLGNKDNIKLRFVSDYMIMAAEGKL